MMTRTKLSGPPKKKLTGPPEKKTEPKKQDNFESKIPKCPSCGRSGFSLIFNKCKGATRHTEYSGPISYEDRLKYNEQKFAEIMDNSSWWEKNRHKFGLEGKTGTFDFTLLSNKAKMETIARMETLFDSEFKTDEIHCEVRICENCLEEQCPNCKRIELYSENALERAETKIRGYDASVVHRSNHDVMRYLVYKIKNESDEDRRNNMKRSLWTKHLD